MKKTIVLYPSLLVSHFVPMLQLVDALLEEGYAAMVALIGATLEEDAALAIAVDRVVSSKPSVNFDTLPRIQNPPSVNNDVDMLLGYFELLRLYNKHLGEFLSSLPPRSIHAVLVDSFSNMVLDITKEPRIPAYSFFTTNASNIAISLQLPWIRAEGQPSFKDLGDTTLNLHDVPPMLASHFIEARGPRDKMYKAMTNSDIKADGILVNTFASLEARAVGALKDPQFLRESRFMMPPVYCIRPLVGSAANSTKEKHKCLAGLDEQPEHRVVFLCFGSVEVANHSEEQLKEIMVGLERSGHRFLWVVQAHLGDNPEKAFGVQANPDLHTLLPEGFLERTKGHGLVVEKWAPQVDMLHHKAAGAFVTHRGWNSVLEGIMPLYMEQKMNKVFMVEEAGIGVEMEFVKAKEVEAKRLATRPLSLAHHAPCRSPRACWPPTPHAARPALAGPQPSADRRSPPLLGMPSHALCTLCSSPPEPDPTTPPTAPLHHAIGRESRPPLMSPIVARPFPPAIKGPRPAVPRHHLTLTSQLAAPYFPYATVPARRRKANHRRLPVHRRHPSPMTIRPSSTDRGVLEEEHEDEFYHKPEPEDQHRKQELPEGFEDGKSNLTL
uniref:UDP-glycosyltransferases domain-containing protein n=1 Tax=Setaria viridis TaxID=4556 RepID=A0A4U6VAD6_SETVI|nr:LOW QUALITY PROTEIN: hypothetical protein SEVIR_3G175400v2 [Setaria viridis]